MREAERHPAPDARSGVQTSLFAERPHEHVDDVAPRVPLEHGRAHVARELVDASAVLSDSGDYDVIEPCMADLAEPVGTLNFFDIQAYIALYNVHDPAADFAAPFGLWNFFDVQAFISAFNAGCD